MSEKYQSKDFDNNIKTIDIENVCTLGIELGYRVEYTLDEVISLFSNSLIKSNSKFLMAQSWEEDRNEQLIVNAIKVIKSKRELKIGKRNYFIFTKQENNKFILTAKKG